jgi:hypothetical protein
VRVRMWACVHVRVRWLVYVVHALMKVSTAELSRYSSGQADLEITESLNPVIS